ncbi:tripartite tricarboxylate transporter permease, partial [Halobacterium bonnevillei]|uniref:tripartite tricarboxylate transporter permease n=1 Tax=Halobacterium bonnevillei TaxID=2692200 RepID=UPI002D80BC69
MLWARTGAARELPGVAAGGGRAARPRAAPPRGAALLAAGVTHSFLDVVPTLALGVPDPAMAVSALPGHRLVMGGRGREALRVSALGSGVAVAVAFALGVPVTRAARVLAPVVYDHIAVVVAALLVVLLVREQSRRARVGAGLAVAASGALGVVALPWIERRAPTGDVLALFAGCSVHRLRPPTVALASPSRTTRWSLTA